MYGSPATKDLKEATFIQMGDFFTTGHTTKMESKQLYLAHRNKLREAAKMRRQKNMDQIEEENKTPEEELNDMEISNSSKHCLSGCSRNSLGTATA